MEIIFLNLLKKAKENCRLDELLSELKILNTTIHLKKPDTITYRVAMNHKIHAKNDAFEIQLSQDIYRTSDGFRITPVSNSICCNACCRKCGICYHNFECTCYDYLIKSLICKHIHKVCGIKKNKM